MARRNPNPGITHQSPSRRFPKGGWVVRYRDAENATLRRTFETRQEALDFQAAVRTDKNRGDFINPRRAAKPFRDVAEDWYATAAPRLRPKTAAGYRSVLDTHLLPALGPQPIGRIRAAAIERLIAGLNVSPGTQRNVLRVLSPIMRHAIKADLIRVNPCSMVELPKVHRTEMLFLTAKQVAAVAEELTPVYRTLVLTAACTGMRAGELSALRVKRLDLMRGKIMVAESVADVGGHLYYGPPKSGKARTIALPPFLVQLLAVQTAGKGPEDFVFTGPNGAPLRHGNYYARHFKPAVRRALPAHLHALRFHDLRHTCASLLIAQGVHPKAVAERLGHGSVAITMDRYGHLYDDHEEPIVAGLQETFQRAIASGAKEATITPLAP